MDMIILLILLVNIRFISSGEWGNPVFTIPDNFPCNPSTAFEEKCPNWRFNPDDPARIIYIKFDEEQKNPITIAFVNCTDCEKNDLKIGQFEEGSKSLLGPDLNEDENEKGKYLLTIKNRLDYESEDQREFKFSLVLENYREYMVKIVVLDIDDNEPRVTVHQIPCIIPENYPISKFWYDEEKKPGKTNCTYSIHDPDTIHTVDQIKFLIPDNVKKYFNMNLIIDPINKTNAESVLYVNEGEGNQLDFETMPVYYFTIIAEDGGGNQGKAQIMIKVKDENDQPPVWIDIFVMQSFEENKKQKFTVYAKDGDLEVDDKITYDRDCGLFNNSIKIEPDKDGLKANILVSEIDRENPTVENNANTIKCTIIASDPIFQNKAEINFIIKDVNDNKPNITLNEKQKYPIELREEETITLEEIFSVDDKDEGNNAQFDVTLENEVGNTINYTEPFQVIPNNGYRNWKFSISVIKPELLDYDRRPDWRKFSLKIRSQDKGTNPMHDEKSIQIILKNLNDEIPEFDKKTNYELNIREDVNASAYILNVLATDADYNDKVEYTLASSDYELKLQENNSVTIYTARDKVLDYEKIRVVYIQILAKDTLLVDNDPLHTVTQQITINVQDVNDEKPRLTLPYETPNIKEHSDIGSEIATITAVDVDTKAELKLEIIWEESRATKLGVQVETSKFENVFSIDSTYPTGSKGTIKGILKVKDKNTFDYEVFDTIFLKIQVTDIGQEMGDGIDEGIMTVLLIDINDNAPKFNPETIQSNKTVTEHSKSDVKIATIIAKDDDGPGNNDITYYLEPIKGTKPGLVKILPKSGELVVDKNEEIDADYPDYIEYLYYNVIANDICHNTTEQIEIFVEDLNDMKPFLEKNLENDLKIKERERTDKKECIQTILGHDYDRDYPHNYVTYDLNNEITQLFQKYEVDVTSGEVCAVGKIEWINGQDTDKIYVILEDNIGGRSSNVEKFNFTIKIQDIDNHDPELPKDITIKDPPIRENLGPGTVIGEIIATDADEPCTENTEIEYSLQDDENVELFDIKNEAGSAPRCDQIGILITKKSLEGHYGKVTIKVRAKNPKKTSFVEEKYDINVGPYNFKPPKIIYPSDIDSTIILLEKQTIDKQLIGIDERPLKDFEASDDQGGKYKMQFTTDADLWDPTFKLIQPNKNFARLVLTKDPSEKEYRLKFRAYHDGEGSANRFVEQTITVKFVDKDQLPGFNDLEDEVAFIEETMETRCQNFKKAEDPKCFNDDGCNFITYYHIMNNEEKMFFEFDISDKNSPKLCLRNKLDREEQAFHYLTIVATNYELAPPKIPTDYHPLNLTVTVIDINDNPPVFDSKLFKGGLADSDKIDSVIVELKATDPDEVDEGRLRYQIKKNIINVSDPSLENIKNNAFKIENNEIRNQFQPSQQMQGYFFFEVQVFDTLNFSDTAEVKIHILSDANRVTFRFEEDIDIVKDKTDKIAEIFTKEFGYSCTIDDFAKKMYEPTKSIRESGFITEVKTHFVDNKDDPVEKEEISLKLDDVTIVGKLKIRLEDAGLTLIYVDSTNDLKDDTEDMNYLLKILLIVVSVVLGTLCVILIIAFILRTRSLQKRIGAMTTNVFGSTKSDLNRIGTSAPGTNRHAIEANPVWNNEVDNINTQFDAVSQASDGSDLIGIEDKPDFAYDNRRASINPVIHQRISEQSDDNMNFQKFSTYDDDDIRSLPDSNNFKSNNGPMF